MWDEIILLSSYNTFLGFSNGEKLEEKRLIFVITVLSFLRLQRRENLVADIDKRVEISELTVNL